MAIRNPGSITLSRAGNQRAIRAAAGSVAAAPRRGGAWPAAGIAAVAARRTGALTRPPGLCGKL
jgi:hypothetical protein